MIRRLSWFLAFSLCGPGAMAATEEPLVTSKDLPRIKPTEPKDALATFKIKKGFRLELVAAEPLVVDPIALSFDENGRLFVVEMRDYSERRAERLGRIRLLEDRNGDGRFETSRVFAEDLPWPTAVVCYDGGIFVGCTPDILFLKDVDGDGKAEVRKVVFTGFGADKDRLNVQAMMNSFQWTLDHRIHGATAPSGGSIVSVNQPSIRPLQLNGKDFSFDPRTGSIRAESGGGQHGLSFDRFGKKFVCSNSHHIQALMHEFHYSGLTPFYSMPDPLVDIAVDGPAAEVFRLSPDEPWRIIRTQWRVSGKVSGPIEGGGRVSGYFTGATGATIYRGDAYPPDFLNNAFTGDAGGNLVHRKIIRREGLNFVAERPGDERNVEFLASSDNWFRPVQFANAPDGCFYIADMYREVIEHPWSLPASIKQHLDLNSGNDRGRIYRIVPDGFKQPRSPRLGKASTKELVSLLNHRNGWHRDTASRLLYQRQDPKTVGQLKTSLKKLPSVEALYSLKGQGGLSLDDLLPHFTADLPALRENAIRLSENFISNTGAIPKKLLVALNERVSDSSVEVRYQLAFTLGLINAPEKPNLLAKLHHQGNGGPWMDAALLNATGSDAFKVFTILHQGNLASLETGLLPDLLKIIGTKNEPEEINGIARMLSTSSEAERVFGFNALAQGFQRGGKNINRLIPPEILEQSQKLALDAKAPEKHRMAAVQLLGFADPSQNSLTLIQILTRPAPVPLQVAAASSLFRAANSNLIKTVLKDWGSFHPTVQRQILTLLLNKAESALALLSGIEEGLVKQTALTPTQIQRLRAYPDSAIKNRALRIFGLKNREGRTEVISRFTTSLNLPGDTTRGQKIFLERCASCHRAGSEGFALGPDLTTVQGSGKEMLLVNILDPNREVAPAYLSSNIETKENELLTGILANETPASVTLKQASGVEQQILRSQIKKIESSNQSLMPEGLEEGLNLQQVADLLEFVTSLGKKE